MSTSIGRALWAIGLSTLLVVGAGGEVAAESRLDVARDRRERLAHRITRLRHGQRDRERALVLAFEITTKLLRIGAAPHVGDVQVRWWMVRRQLLRERKLLGHRLERLERLHRRELEHLVGQRETVLAYIERYGIFRKCPVRGPHVVSDDFGVVVRKKGVPVHRHMGNDISAPAWTPVVAPFSGTAAASPNKLGGLAVKVYGDRGYIYGAHLIAYGRLGRVHAGSVIGYVGATGDAGSYHLHFEWHPWDGVAIDPYPYLMAVC
jgi:murein DD-endopeptidase MepM/ murein hydrolase activator NlpD